MIIKESLTFDDVLLVPQYSEIRSRADIDLSMDFPKQLSFNIPVMPANMANIVGYDVAEQFFNLKGLCFLHRFQSIEAQLDTFNNLLKMNGDEVFNYIGCSVGIKQEDKDNIKKFIDIGVRIICIDIAHADSIGCVEMTQFISNNYPQVLLVAGNVATADGAIRLWSAGADACKVNVGAGSICSTRMRTGFGVPQFCALMDIWNARNDSQIFNDKIIIADGGCNKTADLVKSLCLSDIVMSGNVFSGSIDCPGYIIENNGKKYKRYDGSSTLKSDYIEGYQSLVEVKSSIKDIVEDMRQGISSGCSYAGARNLKELQLKAKFIKITNAGIKENGAHDVFVLGK